MPAFRLPESLIPRPTPLPKRANRSLESTVEDVEVETVAETKDVEVEPVAETKDVEVEPVAETNDVEVEPVAETETKAAETETKDVDKPVEESKDDTQGDVIVVEDLERTKTLRQLRDMCVARDLSAKGNKAELVARLS